MLKSFESASSTNECVGGSEELLKSDLGDGNVFYSDIYILINFLYHCAEN